MHHFPFMTLFHPLILSCSPFHSVNMGFMDSLSINMVSWYNISLWEYYWPHIPDCPWIRERWPIYVQAVTTHQCSQTAWCRERLSRNPLTGLDSRSSYVMYSVVVYKSSSAASASADCIIWLWHFSMHFITTYRNRWISNSKICITLLPSFLCSSIWLWTGWPVDLHLNIKCCKSHHQKSFI